MKNRFQGIVIGLVLGMALTTLVFADTMTELISVVFDNYRVIVNGIEKSDFGDTPPLNYNGRIYVPLRHISEALGKSVGWDEENKAVYIDDEYIDEFEFVPEKTLSDDEMKDSIATIKTRLNNAGVIDYTTSIFDGSIVISTPKDTVSQAVIDTCTKKGVLSFKDAFGKEVLTRADMTSAYACKDNVLQQGIEQNYIEIALTNNGRQKFKEATSRISKLENGKNFISVWVDDVLYSAPLVYSELDAERVVIAGAFTEQTAKALASTLNSKELPCSFKVKSNK
ncbi:MAG: hypothetical protein IKJ06_06480 [Clostridia bacterium]|nr:hypothetical protein [Clostridia bacterium]